MCTTLEFLIFSDVKKLTYRKKQVVRVHIDNTMPYFADEENIPEHTPGPSDLHYSSS